MSTIVYEQSASGAGSTNQGQHGPSMSMRKWNWLIITPLDFVVPNTAYASGIQAYIQAAAVNDNAGDRLQLIGPIQEREAQNTDPKKLEFADGLSVELYSGTYGMVAFFGDDDLHKQALRQTLRGQESSKRLLAVDHDLKIVGTVGEAGQRGFTPASLNARDIALDYGDGAKQGMHIALADTSEVNGGNLLIQGTKGFNPASIRMVANVHIQVIQDLATRVVSVAYMSTGSVIGLNLAEKYATELSTNPALLVAKNHQTGAALTITTAVPGIIDGQHVITYTFGATGFPTAPGGIDLKLDVVSAVFAELANYFETPETLYIPV